MRIAPLLALALIAGRSAAADKPADSLAQVLETYIQQTARNGFTGAVLVAVDGKVVVQRTYGVPVGPDGREPTFWIASNSKQFTAAAILKLQDEGKLSVRDSITRFIRGVPADKRAITIHHLLTHTAGLGTHYAADGLLDRDQAVRALLRAKLEWPVGAEHHYSNDGYNLLAVIVEIASGDPYESYLRTRLFEPVGMSRTGFWGHETEAMRPLAPLADTTRARRIRPTIYLRGASQANWGYRGATGNFSSAGDLYLWMQALWKGKILSETARAQMFAPAVPVRGNAHYGYGWGVIVQDGRRYAVNHAGNEDWLGHNGVLWMYENGDIVIVLSNAGDHNGEGWSRIVARGIRKHLRP